MIIFEQNSNREKVRTHPQSNLQSALIAWTVGKRHRTTNVNNVPMAVGRELMWHVVYFIVSR